MPVADGDTSNSLLRPDVGPYVAPSNALAPQPTWADAAQWHAKNLGNTWSAMQDPQMWVNAARQYGNALLMGTTAPGRTVTLYHGTSPEGLEAIQSSGKINAPAFFTPSKRAAGDYAGGGPVIEVAVPKSALKVDFDLPGAQLLSVKEANGYSGNEDWTIDDYLNAGHSVGVEKPLSIKGARIHGQE